MSTDLNELKALVATLKADQQAQKEKEARGAWTKYVSLSMIWLAVLAAVATQRGAGYSSTTMKQLNEATFNQAEASDQWAYYQAKGIKQSIVEMEHDRSTTGGSSLDAKSLAALTAKIDRYENEKKDITKAAKELEAKRDAARALAASAADRGREMGLSTTIFQIAIALGGMCLVVKKRWLWYVSISIGILATLQMFKVFMM
jgi:Domain of unknown function (DUF4337)